MEGSFRAVASTAGGCEAVWIALYRMLANAGKLYLQPFIPGWIKGGEYCQRSGCETGGPRFPRGGPLHRR